MVSVVQEEYRDKRNKYLSRSESLLFNLYEESVDDDDFALYIDRVSTPDGRPSVEPDTRSAPASRGSSLSRSGLLQPPDEVDPMQRSSSDVGDRPRGKTTSDAVIPGALGRLPRPRSAIVTRESSVDSSTTLPLLQSSACDDVSAGNLLTVPSSWYRTEVATNVGSTGPSRLVANVQLGLPPPTSSSATTGTTEVTSLRLYSSINSVTNWCLHCWMIK